MLGLPLRFLASHLRGVVLLVGLALIGAIALLGPYPAHRLDYHEVRSTEIVDRNDVPLYHQRGLAGGYCRPVPLDQVSEYVILATLSGEDANFRTHPGVDPVGIVRAVWLNAQARRLAYGGSTITQQLAKLLDRRPRTLWGKILEARDAFRLELDLSKDEILTQYLNRAYYGRLAYGIEAAAQRYYAKRAKDLTLDEASLLAVLPRAPSSYDPARYPGRVLRRRQHVLDQMVQRGWITAQEAILAASRPISLVDPSQERRAPHVLDSIANDRLIVSGKGEQRLTIDVALQERLEKNVRRHLEEIEDRGATQAGIVVMDNATGDVLAMVGSRGYGEAEVAGSVNVATALRAPGSTLKPFVYALMLEEGAHPSTPVLDVPTHWKGYQPRTIRVRYHGVVPLREALGNSMNIPAVRAAGRVGPDRVADLLHRAGLRGVNPDDPHGLPIALGGVSVRLVELAAGYATLARGGRFVPIRLLADQPRAAPTEVMSEQTAYLIADMLSDDKARRREFGLETPLQLPFPVAVKTGTSQAFCDNVVVGFTPELTVAAWVGNFDGKPLHGLLSMQGAAPLWREAMMLAMEQRPKRKFAAPDGIERVALCPLSGMVPGPHCPHRRTDIVAARHLPREVCSWHREGCVALPAEIGGSSGCSGPGKLDPVRNVAAGGGSDQRERRVEILGPPDGATFLIDPHLPRARQRVELRVAVRAPGVQNVRWFVDDRVLAEVPAPFTTSWKLEPGTHRLRAETTWGEPIGDEVGIVVEGKEDS